MLPVHVTDRELLHGVDNATRFMPPPELPCNDTAYRAAVDWFYSRPRVGLSQLNAASVEISPTEAGRHLDAIKTAKGISPNAKIEAMAILLHLWYPQGGDGLDIDKPEPKPKKPRKPKPPSTIFDEVLYKRGSKLRYKMTPVTKLTKKELITVIGWMLKETFDGN